MHDLRELYKLYSKMVYNLALSYVQNVEDAEEIVQDVFLKVHDRQDEFRGDSAVKTWIYRITVNTSLDYLKKQKAAKRSFLQRFSGKQAEEPAHFNHPGVQLEEEEAYRKLFGVINELPVQQKTALILLKIEGMSQAEAAEVMEISAKAVESLFQRAKANLSQKLQKTKEL